MTSSRLQSRGVVCASRGAGLPWARGLGMPRRTSHTIVIMLCRPKRRTDANQQCLESSSGLHPTPVVPHLSDSHPCKLSTPRTSQVQKSPETIPPDNLSPGKIVALSIGTRVTVRVVWKMDTRRPADNGLCERVKHRGV